MSRLFVKGTDFELLEIEEDIHDNKVRFHGGRDVTSRIPAGFYIMPKEWVEERKPKRAEPDVGKTELDRFNIPWFHDSKNWVTPNPPDRAEKGLDWATLQDRFGPTKPVQVVEGFE